MENSTKISLFDRRGLIILPVLIYVLAAGYLLIEHDVLAGWGDPIEYMEGAENLKEYDSPFHPPLYPAIVAGVRLITGDVFWAGKLVSFLSGIAVVILTWMLGRTCFNSNRVALLAASLVVLSPVMIRYSYVVGSDMLGTALFLASVYVLAIAGRGSLKGLLIAGVIGGLAYLTRSVFMAIVPAALLFIFFATPGRWGHRIAKSAWYLAAFVLTIAPWCIISIARHGNLNNLNYANVAFAMFDTTDSWLLFETYAEQYGSAFALLINHPVEIARHMAGNALSFPIDIVVRQGYLAGLVALLGVFTWLRRPSPERIALLLSGATVVLLTLLAWMNPRFFVPVMPVILLFAAYFTVNHLGRSLASYWPRGASTTALLSKVPLRRYAVALVVLVALVAVVIRVPDGFARDNVDDEKRAGLFLMQNTPEDAAILTCSRNLAWYADRPFVTMNLLGDVHPEQLDSLVRSTGAHVLVYTKRHSTYTHPQLEFLLEPDDERVPPSFRSIYRSEDEWPVVAYWIEN
ncbi:MAG: glycosyltransferase family 39 protein [Candidatus Zixiibacteriota bacterium]|nr:MAG: glycosyltransferase family 39 protein [candidate division Zixibacteria bacterium]